MAPSLRTMYKMMSYATRNPGFHEEYLKGFAAPWTALSSFSRIREMSNVFDNTAEIPIPDADDVNYREKIRSRNKRLLDDFSIMTGRMLGAATGACGILALEYIVPRTEGTITQSLILGNTADVAYYMYKKF